MGSKKNKGKNQQQQQPQKKKGMMITQEHMMDKSHMDKTTFAPYLPSDSFYPPYPVNSKQIKIILRDLNYLLYLDFKNFWATILYNPTLKIYLETSLTYFHRRCINKYIKRPQENQRPIDQELKFQLTYEYTEALFKVTLFIYHRIMNFENQNSELSRIYNLKDTIQTKFILDVPKLLQLIQVYGESNPDIVRTIVKTYVKLIHNFYSHMMNQIYPYLNKKIYSNLLEFKLVTDRQQFGVNYSYERRKKDQLSPGQQQLKRKTKLIMQTLSYFETIKNTIDFLPEDCGDNLYFNHDVHLIMQNTFYQLEAAYKVWDWQNQRQILLPMVNYILKFIRDYFIEFFKRLDHYLLKKDRKCRTIEAYLKAFERILKDYGKRITMGKKQKLKILVLYGQIIKKYDLIDFLNRLYLSQCQQPQYEINIDFLVDFKIELENAFDPQRKQQRQQAQRMHQIQAQQQQTIAGDKNEMMQPQLTEKQIQAIKKLQLKTSNDRQQRQLQMIIPKKQREDNYYEKLYKAFDSQITIMYDDEYDDLVDYEKKPIFIDEESSNSQSQEQEKKHRPTNENNPQLFRKPSQRGKQRGGKKTNNNQKGFVKMTDTEVQKTMKKQEQVKKQGKPKYEEKGKPKYQEKNKNYQQKQRAFKKQKLSYVEKSNKNEKEQMIEEEKQLVKVEQKNKQKYDAMQDEPNCKMSIRFENEAEERQFKKYNKQYQESMKQQDTSRQKNNNYHKGKNYKNNNHNNDHRGPKGGNTNKKKYQQK